MNIEQQKAQALNLYRAGRFAEAEAWYRQILAANPKDAVAQANLGGVLLALGRAEEAVDASERALELRPDFPEVLNNLGNALHRAGRSEEALPRFRRAVELKPDWPVPCTNIGQTLRDCGQIEAALQWYDRALALRPDWTEMHQVRLFALQFHPCFDPAAILREQRAWSARHAVPFKTLIQPHENERAPQRRLRVGYVSGDFHDHPAARNVLPLLRHHDRWRFEVFCYSNSAHVDALTDRCRAAADVWRDISTIRDEDAERLIRRDGIDILVDLSLHSARNRLLLLARKPAPVQATFIGYPAGTGVKAIDYRISDPRLDPPDHDRFYVEQTIRLPDSFWCYDYEAMDLALAPDVNELPATKQDRITLGCLNNIHKVNAQVLDLWAQAMRALGHCRLVLLGGGSGYRRHVEARLQSHGIARDQLEFAEHRPRNEYLMLYQQIDLGLDTFPYNGHTTSLDSLWMGVPVVTLVGQTAVGRAGLSQSFNLGLSELAARSPEQFAELAVALARDIPRLSELRRTLRERMRASPLMDASRFARNVEIGYESMWRRWCAR